MEIPFSAVREKLEIPDGFSNDNVIVTDGRPADLPRIVFQRHGPDNSIVSGCRFEIPASTKGSISIFVANSGSVLKIGLNTRLICSIRLWREPHVEIGEHVTINNARLIADASDIFIGRDCMLSDNIIIQSSDQHGIVDLASGEIVNKRRRHVTVGEHVWVGRSVTIMPDVEIGAGSILGTGSIVTNNIDACHAAVGIPARSVRSGTSWTRFPTHATPREQEFFERMRRDHCIGSI